jgi:hypothetical protein
VIGDDEKGIIDFHGIDDADDLLKAMKSVHR